jgi:hypothetical protein
VLHSISSWQSGFLLCCEGDVTSTPAAEAVNQSWALIAALEALRHPKAPHQDLMLRAMALGDVLVVVRANILLSGTPEAEL